MSHGPKTKKKRPEYMDSMSHPCSLLWIWDIVVLMFFSGTFLGRPFNVVGVFALFDP